ncbi:hypothetical protein C9439_05540 [archaeon SCG-AAA382B04]|nr:hypothetical protein C9439_05540 [archaeon SCG-AAA382B04]
MPRILRVNLEEKVKNNKKLELAKELGYQKIIINHTSPNSLKKHRDFSNQYNKLNLVKAIEIKETKVRKLKQKIKKFRPKVNFLIVDGGLEEINTVSLEDKRVDLLYNHVEPNKRGINHVLAKKARENEVGIGFNLKKLLKNNGYLRSRIIQHQIENNQITRKFNSPRVISLFSDNKYQIKKLRDIENLMRVIELKKEDLRKSKKFLDNRIKLNEKYKKERFIEHKKERFIEPGVEKIEESSSINEE